VKLNCAAIPTGFGLKASSLGMKRGSFTGAVTQRIGRLKLASLGTIFLDEVGEIPLDLQPKLLRVLQEREFERLGSSVPFAQMHASLRQPIAIWAQWSASRRSAPICFTD